MRKLCVSQTQILDELGASSPYSSMSMYVNMLGDADAQARIIARQIDEAQSWIETRLGVYMFQTRLVTRPVTVGKVRGTDYDLEEDGYPYSRRDFSLYAAIYLRHKPVVSVQRAGLRLGNSIEQIMDSEFPSGWIDPEVRMGIVHVLPILGAGGTTGSNAAIMVPIVAGRFPGKVDIPLIFSIDYTAGFLPTDYDPDGGIHPSAAYPDIDCNPLVNATRMRAAAGILAICGRTIAPGGGGISMDSLSQSWQGNRFQSEIADYKASCEEEITMMQSQFPIQVLSV